MRRVSVATQNALAAQKRQSLKDTRYKLELALQRLVNGNPQVVKIGTKLSAAAVAKEACVARVTIYRFHEPILVQIRAINDSTPKKKLVENRSELAKSSAQLKEYRQLVLQAQGDVAALARINYRLEAKILELEELIRIRDERIRDLQKQVNVFNPQSKIKLI